MKRLVLLTGLFAFAMFFFSGANYINEPENENQIQLAILLDTSNSMDGLIDQARTQLWKIVNELSTTKKNGKGAVLSVALFEYGNDKIDKKVGFIRKITDFTTDLDKVSEELFNLKTNGGSEFCGQVIGEAVDKLSWSNSKENLRIVFICGNEEFTQGTVSYKMNCNLAKEKDIIVNTIFCGSYDEGVKTEWKNGADLTGGKYTNINQNEKYADLPTPMDTTITELGKKLNDTYIYYGNNGQQAKSRQEAQDFNAIGSGNATMAERSFAKASPVYRNDSWDLIDAVKNEKIVVDENIRATLPLEMQSKTVKEITAIVEEKSNERSLLQKKINSLSTERRIWLTKHTQTQSNNLDAAVIEAIKLQARQKDFK